MNPRQWRRCQYCVCRDKQAIRASVARPGKRSLGLAERHANRADALFDLFFRLIGRQLRQIGMRPSMRADRVPCRGNLLKYFRVPHGRLADGEEQRFGALGCQCLEYGWRIAGPRTVVEGQHHFSLAQEIVGSEVLEFEARPPGGVDFHDARDAGGLGLPGHVAWVATGAAVAAATASAFAGSFCADAALAARAIEIASAQTVATRILCSHPI